MGVGFRNPGVLQKSKLMGLTKKIPSSLEDVVYLYSIELLALWQMVQARSS